MTTTNPKPCSRLLPYVVGQTTDGRHVYNVVKHGRVLTYWFTTHGRAALRGEEVLPEHIDVRDLPAEFQRDVPYGQRVIDALSAGWSPAQ